jgi:CO/xanthine dehydrogenase FAD-binding subunit
LITEARLVCFAVSDRPVRAADAERALGGARPGDGAVRAEARAILRDTVEISGSEEYPAMYRRHLAGVLLDRVLSRLAETEPS